MQQSSQLVEHLFRTEYGKLVAILTRIFGTAHIQLAEDMVQETLISALDHWSVSGIPDNPPAWLMQVAKRKALNELKRNVMMQKHHDQLQPSGNFEIEPVFLEHEISDSQLRMLFTCCHPSINTESQITLILKTLCGFGVKEVSRALLTNEAVIQKRLYRAKKSIRESQLPFGIPGEKALSGRLETVMLSLYLLFNEGYNSTHNDKAIRKDLCLEALRLTHLLKGHFKDQPRLYALLALMCFHAARFEARMDENQAIILFEDQDRDQWNKELIHKGAQYLDKSGRGKLLSTYHLEASIAAEHCLAGSFDSTNWKELQRLYKILEKLKPNPLIKLNLAIIQGQLKGADSALEALKKLESVNSLSHYHLLPATQGFFEMKKENYTSASEYFQKALALEPSPSESKVIIRMIKEFKPKP